MIHRPARHLAWLALPLLPLLGGCGPASPSHRRPPSPTPPASPTSSPSPSPTVTPSPSPAALGRCRSGQLTLSIVSTNGGAGTLEVILAFHNTGTTACTLYGYPGAQMLAASGAPLPTTVIRGGTPLFTAGQPTLVTLAAGGTASFNLGYSDVPSGTATSCPLASRLEVTPPNAYHFLVISATLEACRGQLTVSPVYRGG